MRPNCQTPIENAERPTHSEVQVSINKMLKLNFATKQTFPMTRRAKRTLGIAIESKQLCIRSYNVLLYSFSMLQMLVCNFTTKQVFTVTRCTNIYHRSAFPIPIERADIYYSTLDFQDGRRDTYSPRRDKGSE